VRKEGSGGWVRWWVGGAGGSAVGWTRALTTQAESGEATLEHVEAPDVGELKPDVGELKEAHAPAPSFPPQDVADKGAAPQGGWEGGDDGTLELALPTGPVSHSNSRPQSGGSSGCMEPPAEAVLSDRWLAHLNLNTLT